MLKLINVSKTYKNGDVESVALKGVNVEFGESGSMQNRPPLAFFGDQWLDEET